MITATEPNVDSRGRYSVTQTAKLLGLHRHSVRNLIMRGLLNCEFRPESFRKVVTGDEIIRFWRARI